VIKEDIAINIARAAIARLIGIIGGHRCT